MTPIVFSIRKETPSRIPSKHLCGKKVLHRSRIPAIFPCHYSGTSTIGWLIGCFRATFKRIASLDIFFCHLGTCQNVRFLSVFGFVISTWQCLWIVEIVCFHCSFVPDFQSATSTAAFSLCFPSRNYQLTPS